jgi:hypothetical protein
LIRDPADDLWLRATPRLAAIPESGGGAAYGNLGHYPLKERSLMILPDDGESILIGNAGQLAALAAAFPPEAKVVINNTGTWICGDGGPGDGRNWVHAVTAGRETSADRPILMINSVLLPGPDAPLAPPTRPLGSWDTLGLALNDSLLDSDVLAAAGSVLTDMASLLIAPERPAERAAIPPDSPTVRRLLRVADDLARIARLRALEEAEAAWGDMESECPKCGGPGWYTEVRSGTPEWSCTSCGHRWAGVPAAGGEDGE